MAPREIEIHKLFSHTLPIDRPRTFDEASTLTPASTEGTFKVHLFADWSFKTSKQR